LELGCGKGGIYGRIGKAFPKKNFIGIDIKGARCGVVRKNPWMRE
jgi:tRNA (guanine-N7-)-methyltransferase